MKTYLKLYFLATTFYFLLVSFDNPYSIKRITDKDFRYEFYTFNKKLNPESNKFYYCFKGGLIHCTESGVSGELLNGNFIKMFHNNQLAEQGSFKYGLKIEPTINNEKHRDIVVHRGSDRAGDKDTRHSVSGYIIYMLGVPIL